MTMTITIEELQAENEDLKQRLAASEEREQRYRFIVEGSSDGAWDVNFVTGETYLSPRYAEMLGYQPDEFGNDVKAWTRLIHPDDVAATQQLFHDCLMGSSSLYTSIYRLQHKSGEWRWIVEHGKVALRDEQGKPLRMAGTITDVTQQKQAEERLRHYVAIVEATPDAIAAADHQQRAVLTNKAYRQIVGVESEEEAARIRIADTHPNWAYQLVTEVGIPAAIRDGMWMGESMIVNLKTRQELPVSQVIIAHKDAEGRVDFLSTILHDLRPIKQAEEERAALQRQVIEAQQNAIRELSTPLIPLSRTVVLMPLVGSIDTQRAQLVMETLLEGIAEYQAEIAIIDITGVAVVDTQVANALIQAAQATRLLGAQVILTGIGPSMAQTLVHLGADLSSIQTRGSLQSAIVSALDTETMKPT